MSLLYQRQTDQGARTAAAAATESDTAAAAPDRVDGQVKPYTHAVWFVGKSGFAGEGDCLVTDAMTLIKNFQAKLVVL